MKNNKTKATVAAAAGVALLFGGLTTAALWVDQAHIAGETEIAVGSLALSDLTLSTEGEPAPELWVPGDSHTLTFSSQVDLKGDNLTAELELVNIANHLPVEEFEVVFNDVELDGRTVTDGVPLALTTADDGATLTGSVTIEYKDVTDGTPEDFGGNRHDLMGSTLDITNDITLTLKQV